MFNASHLVFAVLAVISVTANAWGQQQPSRLHLQVVIKQPIREAYDFTAGEAKAQELDISKKLVDKIIDGHWNDFCWELTADAPAPGAPIVTKVLVTLDRQTGNWKLRVDFSTTAAGGILRNVAEIDLVTSQDLGSEGPPSLDRLQERVNDEFCDTVLEKYRKRLHLLIRDNVPVGFGEIKSAGEYAVYISPRFRHFDHSRFTINIMGNDVKFRAVGNVLEVTLKGWSCLRLTVNPDGAPATTLMAFEGAAYLVEFIPPGGPVDLSDTTVQPVQ